MKGTYLGEFQELVLLSVLVLAKNSSWSAFKRDQVPDR